VALSGVARPSVMGIVNVTPDSFFAASRTGATEDALTRGFELQDLGCAIVDVGGESTRPGAHDVDVDEELHRVLAVVGALAQFGRVSIDTRKAPVARRCVAAGATVINDVSGTLLELAGELGVGYVAMHSQGSPATMQLAPHYDDVVDEVFSALADMARRARRAGVGDLWLDPGIGFGKSVSHNLALLAHTSQLVELADRYDAGVLVGTSRKRFLGALGPRELGVDERLEGSLATEAWAIASGAAMIRVHDAAVARQLCDLVARPLTAVGA